MQLQLTDILHLPGRDVQHPQWDTLIGLCNKEPLPVTARLRLYREGDGSAVLWPDGKESHDVILEPGLAFAASFIPGNGFPAPPQDFRGHGTIDCLKSGLFGPSPADNVFGWSMVSGGDWDQKSPSTEAPMLRDFKQVLDLSGRPQRLLFPYVIPYFIWQGVPPGGYATGLCLQSFDEAPVEVTFRYVINQCYAAKGQEWSFAKTICPRGGLRFPLYEDLLTAGYPAGLNSEGHLELSFSVPARIAATAIIATNDYVWSAGQLAQAF